ncbi:Protein PHYTOCHROME KINASE SUBSTRATE 1 [Abeliophyllum distichum]|uniref:Protein PHYTOCHROME KINASE SUBSTRATE 1 n=1 Tax=Abeliophyllum distichum TaxID=126358 RepID=A0ABD1W002_9LAMI
MALVSTSISLNLPSENRNNFRDVSFSSYLHADEEAFVLKLAEESRSRLGSPMSITNGHVNHGRNDTEDREIDVFSAEKYFNERTNDSPKIANKDVSNHQQKRDYLLDIIPTKEKQTPSIRSETSWTSRSALLHRSSRNQKPRRTIKVHVKSFLTRIGCNCSCNDKNSVEIHDYMSDNYSNKNINSGFVTCKEKQAIETYDINVDKSQSSSWFQKDWHCKGFDELVVGLKTDDDFSFPVFNSETRNQPVKMKLQEEEDKTKRESLEVFAFPLLESGKNSLLNWDAITPRMKETEISASSNYDTDSDSSSNLFEIENLSHNSNYPFITRQESDGMSSCITPTTCYAPSEASIEWSVVTASVLDYVDPNYSLHFSPLPQIDLRNSEEQRTNTASPYEPRKTALNAKNTRGKDMTKQRPSILLSCKNHKAVEVAGDAYTTNDKAFSSARIHQRSESFTSMTRFQAENKMEAFDHIRNRQHSFDARFLSRSNSGLAAHLLHIQ